MAKVLVSWGTCHPMDRVLADMEDMPPHSQAPGIMGDMEPHGWGPGGHATPHVVLVTVPTHR